MRWSAFWHASGVSKESQPSVAGSLLADLDAINAHFVSVATDPDYDINEITAIIDSVSGSGSAPRPAFLNMKYSSY